MIAALGVAIFLHGAQLARTCEDLQRAADHADRLTVWTMENARICRSPDPDEISGCVRIDNGVTLENIAQEQWEIQHKARAMKCKLIRKRDRP